MKFFVAFIKEGFKSFALSRGNLLGFQYVFVPVGFLSSTASSTALYRSICSDHTSICSDHTKIFYAAPLPK
jgi:hypothetical protein